MVLQRQFALDFVTSFSVLSSRLKQKFLFIVTEVGTQKMNSHFGVLIVDKTKSSDEKKKEVGVFTTLKFPESTTRDGSKKICFFFFKWVLGGHLGCHPKRRLRAE